MDKWEYKWMFVSTESRGAKKPNLRTESGIFAVKASINQMGRQGWELVSVVPLFSRPTSASGASGSVVVTHETLWVFKKKKKLSITIR